MKDPRYPFALDEGTEIGGYRIDSVLGAGGFGITYRAFNEITQKQVAIKEFYVREISSRDGATVVVDPGVESDTYEYALRKFQEEAQAVVTRFKHPYIIHGENFVRSHNTCYLIMEYIEGRNLDEWLVDRQTPPSEAEIRPFFEKLFDAVDYVHQRNVMHRDLTPRNIMVRLNGDPVLIDFGAAGLGIDLGRSSKIVAQLRYAPPEQSDESATSVHGRYTDIFSLAGVLFRTVTGRSPMPPTTRLSRIAQYRGDGLPDPQAAVATLVAHSADYSPAFLAGIDRGLMLDERQRPQSIAEFRQALGWGGGDSAFSAADAVTKIVTPAPRSPIPALAIPSVSSGAPAEMEPETTFQPVVCVAADDLTRPLTGAGPVDVALPSLVPHAEKRGPADASIQAPPPFSRRRRRIGPVAGLAALVVIALIGAAAGPFRSEFRTWIAGLSAPPLVSPYRFSADFDGRQLKLSGFVASEDIRAAIVGRFRDRLPGVQLKDGLALGRGAPANLTAAAELFARHLPDIAKGSLRLVDTVVSIDATASSPAAYTALQADFVPLVDGGKGSLALIPATVAPYAFQLATGDAGATISAVLSGYLPDLRAKTIIANALRQSLPDVQIDDRTEIASGAAVDLAAVVAHLAPRLALLDHAKLTLVDGGMRLEGTPRDAGSIAAATAPISADDVPGHVPVALAIVPLKLSPYSFKATAAEGSMTLTGFVPDVATRQAALAAIVPDVKRIDHLLIADGAPQNDIEAVRFVVAIANRLETGTVTMTDGTIDVSGTVRRIADVSDLTSALVHHGPAGFTIATPTINLRRDVDAQECDRLALPPDHADRPPGTSGVALEAIDPALAVPACQQAIADFPNVRRFVTALGAALEKDGKYAEAATAFRTSIDVDDATAMALYGIMLRDGLGEAADPLRATALLERAAAQDSGTALFAIGQAYEKGELGCTRDLTEAQRWYLRAASHDSPDANARLGLFAQTGTLDGVADPTLAVSYYQKAAEVRSGLAMQRLGLMHQFGLLVGHVRDPRGAAEWFTRAAATGRTDSMNSLGNLYLEGLGVSADPFKARAWFTKAAEAGDSNAMLQLGRLDFDGVGAERNPAAAIVWFEKAAAAGRTDSFARLGSLFQSTRPDGSKPDYVQARYWDEKGAALDDPQSFYQLGTLYENGLGVPVDHAKAEADFERAGDLGYARGFFQLGLLAELGRGRPVDYARAAGYFRRAADLSYAPAMVRIGVLTMNGTGVPKDDAAALLAFTQALQLGDASARWYAAVLTDAGRGGPKNPDRVATYLLEAFQRHETHAVTAFAGDMSGFSVETRIALQKQLQTRGVLKTPSLDGTYDSATREAVLASVRTNTE